MKVSICIVNYSTYELTKNCIESVIDCCKDISYEVIVVDNASSDDSAKKLSDHFGNKITLITNPINRYFTGGFNQAAYIAQGEYLLILNSDGIFKDNSVKTMLDFLENNPNFGGVCPQVIDLKSNKINQICYQELTRFRHFMRSNGTFFHLLFLPLYLKFHYFGWKRDSSREVEVANNACFMLKKSLFFQLGGFPESLKLYYTEDYQCFQIRKLGYKIWFSAEAKFYHQWASSVNLLPSKLLGAISQSDRNIYFALRHVS